MTYDGLDRLETAVSPMWGDGTTAGTATYTYDVLDNLAGVDIPAAGIHHARQQAFCYDGANRLATVFKNGTCITGTKALDVGYDAQGNLDTWNALDYFFDYGNRLRGVYAAGGDPIETYRYDGLGRRVQMRAPTGEKVLSQYSRDGRLVYQYDQRTSERIDYLSLGNRLVATRTRPISAPVYTTQYQHTDPLGSPVAKSDANGDVQQRDEFESYGKRLNRANDDRPGYTGHVMDAATDLIYMQQRYYDPRIGRFWSVDPVTAFSSPGLNFNRYAYANNNPYKFTDPDGRMINNPLRNWRDPRGPEHRPFKPGGCGAVNACLGGPGDYTAAQASKKSKKAPRSDNRFSDALVESAEENLTLQFDFQGAFGSGGKIGAEVTGDLQAKGTFATTQGYGFDAAARFSASPFHSAQPVDGAYTAFTISGGVPLSVSFTLRGDADGDWEFASAFGTGASLFIGTEIGYESSKQPLRGE